MITLKNLCVAQAEEYYGKEALVEAEWYGSAAKRLKLGTFNEKNYRNALEGKDRAGRYLLKRQTQNRRAGVDCTFSAPKSVSLQALVGGDERLIGAHRRAVERTLEIIEREYAAAKITEGGKRITVKTGNLAIARFHHREARPLDDASEPDPHLHTHCVIINLTCHGDHWRYHANELLYGAQKYLRSVYGHYLGRECERLGYRVYPHQDGKGEFEIEGIERGTIEAFSRRQSEILSYSAKWNVPSSRAWEITRGKKRRRDPEKLSEFWTLRARELKVRFPKPAAAFAPAVSLSPEDWKAAVGETGTREIYFRRESLVTTCLNRSPRPLDPKTIRTDLGERTRIFRPGESYRAAGIEPIAVDGRYLTTGPASERAAVLARRVRKRKGMGISELFPSETGDPALASLTRELAGKESGLALVRLPASPDQALPLVKRLRERLEELGYEIDPETAPRPNRPKLWLVEPSSPGDLLATVEVALLARARVLFLAKPRFLRERIDLVRLLDLPVVNSAKSLRPRSPSWELFLSEIERELPAEDRFSVIDREFPAQNPFPTVDREFPVEDRLLGIERESPTEDRPLPSRERELSPEDWLSSIKRELLAEDRPPAAGRVRPSPVSPSESGRSPTDRDGLTDTSAEIMDEVANRGDDQMEL